YWRRKSITLDQGMQLQEKSTLPASVGIETWLWNGEVQTAYKKSAPNVGVVGETPSSFAARNWNLADGRLLQDVDVDGDRDVCVLGHHLATNAFPFGSPVGDKLKLNGINYTVVGVLEPRGGTRGGNQDNFAVIPITTGMNRFGRWGRSLDIL